jgi:hypothetical protein
LTTDYEEAKEWFNNMNPESRNRMIITLYKISRETNSEKLVESINQQWTDKFIKQAEFIKTLTTENEILQKNQNMGINAVVNKIKDLENNLNNSMVNLASKITPSLNGKIGEDFMDQVLSKIPGAALRNTTQSKGAGDFILEVNSIRIMIESKNWTNSSIKGNPKEIENFKNNAIIAKEENIIDFAIMALHRVTDLRGKPIDIDQEPTKNGTLIMVYATNLFNHPDRILYAVDIGLLLMKQQLNYSVDKEKFMYQINGFLKGIESLQDSVKERSKIARDTISLIKNDSDTLELLKQTMENVLTGSERLPIKDRIIGLYKELSSSTCQKITKVMLEEKCLENGIAARHIRDYGGIKAIRDLATTKPVFNSDSDSE